MCTAATFAAQDFYMGRTLDYERGYGEQVVVTPRNFPLPFRHSGTLAQHYALIGTACVADGYPLYYDAVNEKGLGMAGLNFVGNACYGEPAEGRQNVAQFEFLPWLLAQCATLDEARTALRRIQLVGTPFSASYPAAQMHWLIADRSGCLTVEATEDGLHVYDNPAGVLTNNPPFLQQLFRLNDYQSLSPRQPENRFSDELDLRCYSRGMGALGLPGDLSSASRFVRAAFVRAHLLPGETEAENVGQMFHLLGAVEQQKGCCEVRSGEFEYTIYTSCWNAQRGIYYYTTYDNRQITGIDLHRAHPDGTALTCYPMRTAPSIRMEPERAHT